MRLTPNSDLPPRYRIRNLIANLPQHSLVRRWLEISPQPTGENVAMLFQALAHAKKRSWVDRAVVLHLLGTLELSPSERVETRRMLLDAFLQPQYERFSFPHFLRGLGVLILIGALFFVRPEYNDPVDSPGEIMFIQLCGVTVLSLGLSGIYYFYQAAFPQRYACQTTQRIAATTLASVGDPTCIQPLWQHIALGGPASREALHALKSALPSVTEEWYGRLPAGTEAALAAMSKSIQWPEFAIAALKALGNAGGATSIKAVERLASRARSQKVRAHAVATLSRLIARSEQGRAAATLLRPSSERQAEHLVRPVYGGAPAANDLLRASQPEGSPLSGGEPNP